MPRSILISAFILLTLAGCRAGGVVAPTATETPSPVPTNMPTVILTATPDPTATATLTPTVMSTSTPAFVAAPDDCTGAAIGTKVFVEGTNASIGVSEVVPTDTNFWDFWQISSDNGAVFGIWLYLLPITDPNNLLETGWARLWLPTTDGSAPNHIKPKVANNYRVSNMTLYLNNQTEIIGLNDPLEFAAKGYLWDIHQPDRTEGELSEEICDVLVTTIE